jgi:hypothetical protein
MRKNNAFTTGFKEGINNTNSWFFPAMFLIFLTLKLTNVITWSWWGVTAPLWGPVAFVLLVMFLVALVMLPYQWMRGN